MKGMLILVAKLSLMDVYIIENLRKAGIADDEIKEEVRALNADSYQYVNESFDFTRLHDLSDQIDEILDEGYEVKFLTFTGLINLLRLKFQKEKTRDFEEEQFVVSKLTMTDSELKELKQIVSPNWKINAEDAGVRIEPVYSV